MVLMEVMGQLVLAVVLVHLADPVVPMVVLGNLAPLVVGVVAPVAVLMSVATPEVVMEAMVQNGEPLVLGVEVAAQVYLAPLNQAVEVLAVIMVVVEELVVLLALVYVLPMELALRA